MPCSESVETHLANIMTCSEARVGDKDDDEEEEEEGNE